MPMNEKIYYEKLQAVVEYLEQCLPAHPGAFAAYFQVLDKFPATMQRAIPEDMLNFVEANVAEIEKYYTTTLPAKYRAKTILTPDKRLLDASGNPMNPTSFDPTNFDVGPMVDISNMPEIIGKPLHDEIQKSKLKLV